MSRPPSQWSGSVGAKLSARSAAPTPATNQDRSSYDSVACEHGVSSVARRIPHRKSLDRQLAGDPWRQIADWQDAIGYLRARPEVSADRIGVWGTGYAGGHALVIGATDRRISAIVAQVPSLHGLSRGVDAAGSALAARSDGLFREDCRRRLAGEPASPDTRIV